MLYKNAKIYTLTAQADFSDLTAKLEAIAFRPCGNLDLATMGWTPVIGSLYAHVTQGIITLKLLKETKILPPKVINRMLEERCEAIETETGEIMGKKARSDLREQIVTQLLPRAFTDRVATFGTIIPEENLLFINASSDSEAEVFLAVLRKTLGSLPVVPWARRSLAPDLTTWISDAPPSEVELLQEVELLSYSEDKSLIRAKSQELDSNEITACLDAGKFVQKLAIDYEDLLSMTIMEDGSFKKIKFHSLLIEENEDIPKDQVAARFDADITLSIQALLEVAKNFAEVFQLANEEINIPAKTERLDPVVEPDDEFYQLAKEFVIESRRASTSSLQRKFRIGYNRAARIIDVLEHAGIISKAGHNGNREVLVS